MTEVAEIPEETALYRIFGEADLLLYIGISKSFGQRWKKEAADFTWWAERRRMTVEWLDSRPEAEDAEQAAIKAEHPKYNKRHVPVVAAVDARRPGLAVDQWIGARIRDHRRARNMSQAALAAEMTSRGHSWHQSTVYRIESGRQSSMATEVIALSKIFGYPTVDDFASPAEVAAVRERAA
jgi:ribosome-binding protein aMBF1 (putative translation factor)